MSEYEDLIHVLDEGVDMLRERACLLDEIRGHVQNRRLDELEELMEEDHPVEDVEEELARDLSQHCRALAAERGCACRGGRLSELITSISGSESVKLEQKRHRLVFAIHEVQEKASRLAEMANEARDIEERMILAILGPPDKNKTYGGDGQVNQDRHGIALHQEV